MIVLKLNCRFTRAQIKRFAAVLSRWLRRELQCRAVQNPQLVQARRTSGRSLTAHFFAGKLKKKKNIKLCRGCGAIETPLRRTSSSYGAQLADSSRKECKEYKTFLPHGSMVPHKKRLAMRLIMLRVTNTSYQ